MAECINEQADIFAIDSMPLEICKISREQRNKMGKESEHIYRLKVTVPHRKNIFTDINYIVFVQPPG